MNNKNDGWKAEAIEMAEEGSMSWRAIARELGVSKSTCSDFLRGHFKGYVKPGDLDEDVNTLPPRGKGARVLFLDLEVSASIVAAFSMFKHFSTPDHIIQFPYILTYAANWLHEPVDNIVCEGLDDYPDFETDVADDKALVMALWQLFEQADLVVIQNESFDRGWFTQRCAYHGIPEPSPYRVICTLKGNKKAMSLPSNSLGYVTKYFDLPHKKLHHEGISLWIRCMEGDVEAFQLMKDYNIGDIPTLRELYLKIRAYIPNHPNVSLYFGEDETMRCPVCGGTDLEELDVKAFTNMSAFTAYRCGGCGSVNRSGISLTTSKQRKSFLRKNMK